MENFFDSNDLVSLPTEQSKESNSYRSNLQQQTQWEDLSLSYQANPEHIFASNEQIAEVKQLIREEQEKEKKKQEEKQKRSSHFQINGWLKESSKLSEEIEPISEEEKQLQEALKLSRQEFEKEKSYPNKQSQKINQLGDEKDPLDDSLADNGENKKYLYSCMDMNSLLADLRKKELFNGNSFCNELVINYSEAAVFNEYRIFIANACTLDNFGCYFMGEMENITGKSKQVRKDQLWCEKQPTLLLLPILDAEAKHWRCIKVILDYLQYNPQIQILFDDPFGGYGWPEQAKEQVWQCLLGGLKLLFAKMGLNFDEVTQNQLVKTLKQQNNSVDCGTIIMSNTRDYVAHYKEKKTEIKYTVPYCEDEMHSITIEGLRLEDSQIVKNSRQWQEPNKSKVPFNLKMN